MQWEYTTLRLAADIINPLTLNELGKKGWELVSVDNNTAFFKRGKAFSININEEDIKWIKKEVAEELRLGLESALKKVK